jgi:hypothetical protein
MKTVTSKSLTRVLNSLIDDAERQAYGLDVERVRGEQKAYRDILAQVSGDVDALNFASRINNGFFSSCEPRQTGYRAGLGYFVQLLQDVDAGDPTACAILTDIG